MKKNSTTLGHQINTCAHGKQGPTEDLKGLKFLFIAFLGHIAFFSLLIPGLFLFSSSFDKKEIFLTLFCLISFLFFIFIIAFYYLRFYLNELLGQR